MKVEVKQSLIHGMGVFASKDIARGEVVLRVDDSRIVDDDNPVREDLGESPDHCDCLYGGTTILMGEPERYINQSCDPNVFVYSVNRIRFVLAMRDIPAGEEIAYDYAVNAVDGDVWTCGCGTSNCRGRHKCDFFSLPEVRQLEYLPFLDPEFASLHKDKIQNLLNRTHRMPSK